MKINTDDVDLKFESITCPICSSDKHETVYQCFQETGYTLGRVETSFVVCDECGFMYQNPRPTTEVLKVHYSENIEASGTVYHDETPNSIYDMKQKARQEFYEKYFRIINKGKLLEVGCSTGAFLRTLDLDDWELTGLEASEEAIIQPVSNNIKIIPGFLEDVDLPKSSYDVVCCFGVLEHLHDINNTLRIMTDILKLGGFICIEVPDTMKPEPQVSEFFTFEHMSHFTAETLIMFLKGYGYSEFVIDDTVTDARLRLIATKANKMKPVYECGISDEEKISITKYRHEFINIVDKYKLTKKMFEHELSDRVLSTIRKWSQNNKNIAVYGAGVHTRYLMSLFDISDSVTAILDSDPKKHGKKYLRWNILDEHILELGGIDAVIISSKAYEDEIYKRLEKYSKNFNIDILRCYS